MGEIFPRVTHQLDTNLGARFLHLSYLAARLCLINSESASALSGLPRCTFQPGQPVTVLTPNIPELLLEEEVDLCLQLCPVVPAGSVARTKIS